MYLPHESRLCSIFVCLTTPDFEVYVSASDSEVCLSILMIIIAVIIRGVFFSSLRMLDAASARCTRMEASLSCTHFYRSLLRVAHGAVE